MRHELVASFIVVWVAICVAYAALAMSYAQGFKQQCAVGVIVIAMITVVPIAVIDGPHLYQKYVSAFESLTGSSD